MKVDPHRDSRDRGRTDSRLPDRVENLRWVVRNGVPGKDVDLSVIAVQPIESVNLNKKGDSIIEKDRC